MTTGWRWRPANQLPWLLEVGAPRLVARHKSPTSGGRAQRCSAYSAGQRGIRREGGAFAEREAAREASQSKTKQNKTKRKNFPPSLAAYGWRALALALVAALIFGRREKSRAFKQSNLPAAGLRKRRQLAKLARRAGPPSSGRPTRLLEGQARWPALGGFSQLGGQWRWRWRPRRQLLVLAPNISRAAL